MTDWKDFSRKLDSESVNGCHSTASGVCGSAAKISSVLREGLQMEVINFMTELRVHIYNFEINFLVSHYLEVLFP